jgi:hypothetical protein
VKFNTGTLANAATPSCGGAFLLSNQPILDGMSKSAASRRLVVSDRARGSPISSPGAGTASLPHNRSGPVLFVERLQSFIVASPKTAPCPRALNSSVKRRFALSLDFFTSN